MNPRNFEVKAPSDQNSLLDQVEILHKEAITGNVVAMVPVELIYQQDVAVDSSHVMDLAASIKKEAEENGGHGQLSPVSLAEVIDFDQFPIMDGFHRTPAVQSLGRKEVFATIRPNSTWDDVIDHRILAATTHRSVRFSRVVEWVEESWRRTPWANRIGSISAFNLAFQKAMTGERLGLQPEEAEQIKQWVNKKCDFWHLSPSTIYNNLNIARTAAPELVHDARERRRGDKLDALTPQHLSVVTKILPNNFGVQRLVAEIAKKHAMTVPKTRAVAKILSNAKDLVEAEKIVEETNWEDVEPVLAESSRQRTEPARLGALEQTANANYILSNLEGVIKSIGERALRGLFKAEELNPQNQAELAQRLRLMGKRCLELAYTIEKVPAPKPTPAPTRIITLPKNESIVEPKPTNTKQKEPSKQNKPKPKLSAEEKDLLAFENTLLNYIEGKAKIPYMSPYMSDSRLSLARSILERLSQNKRMGEDKDLADRSVELQLAISKAEERMQKRATVKK